MKIIESTEMRPVTIKKYIASDGKEYETYDECYRHEKYLKEEDYETYFEDKATGVWVDSYEGLGGYLGGGCDGLYLIEVDDKVIEFSHYVKMDAIDEYKGKKVFLVGSGFESISDWYFMGTIDDVIETLKGEIAWLEERR